MIRRASLQRLCPQGKQRRIRTLAAPLARQGKAASQGAAAFFPLRQDGTQRKKNHRPDPFKPLAPQGQAASPPQPPQPPTPPHPKRQGIVTGRLRLNARCTASPARIARLAASMQARGGICGTHLAPPGQGTRRVCAFDAVCPCGRRRVRVGAPRPVYRGRENFPERFAIELVSKKQTQKKGSRKASFRSKLALCPSKAPTGAPGKAMPFAAQPQRAHRAQRSQRRKVQRPALPAAAFFLRHPAGPPKGPLPWASLFGTRPRLPVPQNRRRRMAPARGPSAVNAHRRPIRNETQRPSPLLMGLGRVYPEPKALAAGTAGPSGTAG